MTKKKADPKAPYHAPTLTEHGTIHGMTNTRFTRGPNDADGPGSYVS
ncbi:MAG TPA: hypothetical protein PKD99_11215 [Sphingopyxis sp.]|nr:hypothetical protein [Sphingopyxis sp.]HMP45666.1 hypothetical protein [Sphingopyxis sp.]HMQ17906.1 hypothetical protein [Sphingopyxis sp.]